MGVGGLEGINPGLQPATNQSHSVKEFSQQMQSLVEAGQEALKDLSEEVQASGGITKGQVGLSEKGSGRLSNLQQKQDIPQQTKISDEMLEAFASEIAKEKVEEKKKKERKKGVKEFLKGVKTLSLTVEGMLDNKDIPEEEKRELEKFQKNMRQMNQLQRELEFLEAKEEQYLKIIENQKNQKQTNDQNQQMPPNSGEK